MKYLLILASLILGKGCSSNNIKNEQPPNIVLILADDLGYGDPSCYNPSSKYLVQHQVVWH